MPEHHVLQGVKKVFDRYQPRDLRNSDALGGHVQLLVRELALDGGLRVDSGGHHATMRVRYSFDNCR